MDFTPTDEQEMVRDTARSLFAKECPPSLVRAHIDDPDAAAPLWSHLRHWVVLADGPLTDLCLFAEEAGFSLVPGPFFATAALFGPILRAAGMDAAADRCAAGELTGTVALAGSDGVWRGDPVTPDDVRMFVLEADRVDQIAILMSGPGPGPVVVVVVVDADELPTPVRHVAGLDTTRRGFTIDVPTGLADTGAATAPIAPAALTTVIDRATVVLAAELVGTARWLVEHTVAYAKERVQFDKPIGAFQAVQHQLVDMALDLERATAAVYYAAMALDAVHPDRHRAVHTAKAAAGTAARHCAKVGLQLHGGIGYTWEHDLHLYLRRAYASDDLLGDVAHHHDRLADLIFDRPPSR